MAEIKLEPPLVPRRGSTLQVLLICRVSDPGPNKQDEKSNEDQEAEYRKWVKDRVDVPFEVTVIPGTGSGEYLDRKESERANGELESGTYDLVIAEDLGRIFRRVHAFLFCEAAEDVGTRVIAPNDYLDTKRDDWRLCAFFAALRHEMYNADTGKRIRRTLRNRFQQGEVVQFVIAGYIKPKKKSNDDKIHDSQVAKDPAAEEVYDEWFTRLEKGETFAEVADWLNAIGFSTGPHHRNKEWDGRMVARVTRNPILKGVRVRNDKMSKRINRTGRRKSIKAPEKERLERECPHLAFIEPKRYDRVIRMLKERNAKYQRNDDNGGEARRRGPRKRTRWPGQHLFCAVCRHMFVWGGHGQTDRLMCDGCRHYHCWQAISVAGPLAASKMTESIFAAIEALPGFDPCLHEMLREEISQKNDLRNRRLREIQRQLMKVNREIENVMAFIRNGSKSATVREDLERLEGDKSQLEDERDRLLQQPKTVPVLPAMDEIKQLARAAMDRHVDDPYAFGELMRNWIPRIVVAPYRLFDAGQIVLRARFQLNLVTLLPDAQHLQGVEETLFRELEVDLFNSPNERDRYRERAVEMKAQDANLTQSQIAVELGITKTAVQRAFALQRSMDELGLKDPYIPVLEPPEDYTKLRRHKHPRYEFKPLEDLDI